MDFQVKFFVHYNISCMAGSTDIHTLVIVSSSCIEIVAKETNTTNITDINNMYCSKETDSFVVTTGTCVAMSQLYLCFICQYYIFLFYIFL